MDRLRAIVSTNIAFKYPYKLQVLSSNLQKNNKFPNMKSSFEFPPKTINTIIDLFFKEAYASLNFFDIVRLLKELEKDSISEKVKEKEKFSKLLFGFYNTCEIYIKHGIIQAVTKVFTAKNSHSFEHHLRKNMSSSEFSFICQCIDEKFVSVKKTIKNKSLKKVLAHYGIGKVLSNTRMQYQKYLMKELMKVSLDSSTTEHYKNNFLDDEYLDLMYRNIENTIAIIENKYQLNNNKYLEEILLNALGDIENDNSKWHTLVVPPDLQERYRRLKGIFEFQRFVDIVTYLTKHPELHFSEDEHGSDKKRLINRSTFWSNYDERFSSVKMWLSEEDYRLISIDKPVDLSDIRTLKNINNESCMFEFKESELLIIEFFRLRDGRIRFSSMIFQNEIIKTVKERLNSSEFTLSLYEELQALATFNINHKFLWQGWVDKFLRDKGIFPNQSILGGKKFISGKRSVYKKAIGLEDTRRQALEEDIKYEDIICSPRRRL